MFVRNAAYSPSGSSAAKEANMNRTEQLTLGDLISLFYEEYLALYGDEELASVAAAATINELLAERAECPEDAEEAA
jgi:hypothetical protein